MCFASLGGNPFDDASAADETTVSGELDTAAVEVGMDGQRHTFEWPADKRLLDLLKENGDGGMVDGLHGGRHQVASRRAAAE